jgi:hypothetical protein
VGDLGLTLSCVLQGDLGGVVSFEGEHTGDVVLVVHRSSFRGDVGVMGVVVSCTPESLVAELSLPPNMEVGTTVRTSYFCACT